MKTIRTFVRSPRQRFIATTTLSLTFITVIMLTFSSDLSFLVPLQFHQDSRSALILSGVKKDLQTSIKEARADSKCIDTPLDNRTSPRYAISLLNMRKPKFLKNYRNPCWFDNRTNKLDALRCLPYFYVAGFPKCGTTDLFFRLVQHPLIVSARYKEPHYLTRRMFSRTCKAKKLTIKERSTCAVEYYTSWYFREAARMIRRNRRDEESSVRFESHLGPIFRSQVHKVMRQESMKIQYPMVTVDGSASTAWDHRGWTGIAENEGCPSPAVSTADIVARLNPWVKVIFILRDPTDRLYSDYLYFGKTRFVSPEDFHKRVVSSIDNLRNCTINTSMKLCLMQPHAVRLAVGVYNEYISEWLQILPRSQIHVIHSETYRTDVVGTLAQAITFLNLPNLSDDVMERIANLKEKNTNKKKNRVGPMLPETERLLREFYSEYNEKLARILQDERFVWRKQIVTEKG